MENPETRVEVHFPGGSASVERKLSGRDGWEDRFVVRDRNGAEVGVPGWAFRALIRMLGREP